MRTVPSVGATTPEMHLMSVDLPAPLGPTMQCTSPGMTSKSTPSRARTPGYCLMTPRTSSNGVGMSGHHQRAQCGVGDVETALAPLLGAAPDRVFVFDAEHAVEAALVHHVEQAAPVDVAEAGHAAPPPTDAPRVLADERLARPSVPVARRGVELDVLGLGVRDVVEV